MAYEVYPIPGDWVFDDPQAIGTGEFVGNTIVYTSDDGPFDSSLFAGAYVPWSFTSFAAVKVNYTNSINLDDAGINVVLVLNGNRWATFGIRDNSAGAHEIELLFPADFTDIGSADEPHVFSITIQGFVAPPTPFTVTITEVQVDGVIDPGAPETFWTGKVGVREFLP